jgi:hypothetical protein
MENALSKHDVSWVNCVSIGVDNTSVNMGCRNSIKTRIVQKNPAVYVMGCPCHILHNTAGKAASAFDNVPKLFLTVAPLHLLFCFTSCRFLALM